MMAAVACAAVPKITIVIGGCFGSDSYVMVWVAPAQALGTHTPVTLLECHCISKAQLGSSSSELVFK